ncbi:hypothetical protein IQ06DRAFT_258054 [Phaeosphaeriaceae sp. SRC1lsM3a]|nr:hypothetical protein IQ06DRAFT_258054 [Stagonospora sp. SRC1lsM3a]
MDISNGQKQLAATSSTQSSPIPNQANEYLYGKLSDPTTEIRLLVLLPDIRAEPLRCRIKTSKPISVYSVDETRSPYAAVSYTWATEDGDASKTQRIHICSGDDREQWAYLDVTANCEHALQQLRDEHSERVVWIDSVCINQKDLKERNMQVSGMDFIFMCATHVDICIPASSKDFRKALMLLEHRSDIHRNIERRGDDGHSYPYIDQLTRLFSLRYFSRVWVVQEVVLASKVFLHVGSVVVPFEQKTIKRIYDVCSQRWENDTIRSPLEVHLKHWTSVWRRNMAPDMVSVLNMSMDCSATDPRDRVFAIIGLLPTSIRSIIPINYSLSLEHVLAYAANACIRSRGDLEILRYAALPETEDVSTASTFGIEHFKHFLERTGQKDGDSHVYAVMQHHTLIPPGQILPRLQVVARFLDVCDTTTSQSIYDLRTIDERYPNWAWFLDAISNRYEPGIPEVDILAAVQGEVRYAIRQRPSEIQFAFRAQNSVGFTASKCVPGDAIYDIFGAPFPFLLRKVDEGSYRIVGECYLFADVNARYWHPSQLDSGLSYKQPDLAKCRPWARQVIEVY